MKHKHINITNEHTGQIVAAFGRSYLIQTMGGLFSCVPRGKKSIFACGDWVNLDETGDHEGVITSARERSTLLLRSAAHRQKLIAANATQVAIIVASDPSFSDELVARILVAAESAGMESIIILNKSDLEEKYIAARQRLEPFAKAGYKVLSLSAKNDINPMLPVLDGNMTVFIGQSGMGKSTLVNALIPGTNAATREISTFLASGKHTTTNARLYRLDEHSTVVDCPGLQEFGLAHLDWREIASGFREFSPFAGQCRYPDCRHLTEPGCSIAAATALGTIHERRLELYRRIITAEGAR